MTTNNRVHLSSERYSKTQPGRFSFGTIPRAVRWTLYRLFRNDIFISYTRSDAGRNYAHALALELQRRKFEVLMDTFEARPSPEIPEALLEKMQRCLQLVIVASPSAVTSAAVAREVERFPKKGRSIVLLEFSQNVRATDWYQTHLHGLPPVPVRETAWARKSASFEVVPSVDRSAVTPDTETVDLIVNAFRFKRQRQRQALIAGLTAIATVALLIVVGSLLRKSNQLGVQVQSQETTLSGQQEKIAGQLSTIGEQAAKIDGQNRTISTQRTTIGTQKEKIDRQEGVLKIQEAAMRQAQRGLDSAAAMTAAIKAAESDPVLAYQLARKALVLVRNDENERLFRVIASQTRYPYSEKLPGCSLEDSYGARALLHCVKDQQQTWTMVNLNDGRRYAVPSSVAYEHAWLSASGESWIFLGQRRGAPIRGTDTLGVVIDVIGAKGTRSVAAPRWRGQHCGPSRLLLTGYAVFSAGMLDPATGQVTDLPYSWVSCRQDGGYIGLSEGNMTIVDKDGHASPARKIREPNAGDRYPSGMPTYESDLDYIDRWSPDGKFLAVQGGEDIYLLDTAAATLASLTTDGIVDTAFAWEAPHTLLVSSHTRDQADYHIAAFDSADPVRKIRYSVPGLVTRLFELANGDAGILYASGAFEDRLHDGAVVYRLSHPGQDSFAGGNGVLVTSSGTETRIWPGTLPASSWVFTSTPTRTYVPCAAGDPANRWLATVFRTETGLGLEVRSVSGSRRADTSLPLSIKTCTLAFSLDGRWLIVWGGGTGGVVYDTRTWAGDPNTWKTYQVPPEFEFPDRDTSPEAAFAFKLYGIDLTSETGKAILHTNYRRGSEKQDPPFEIDLTGDAPQFLKTDSGNMADQCNHVAEGDIMHDLPGWEFATAASPADFSWQECTRAGWVEHVLIKKDAGDDIEFAPLGTDRLLQIFDEMMPAATVNSAQDGVSPNSR